MWFRRYRWKELSVTYILSYLLTDQSSHRIGISWLKTDWSFIPNLNLNTSTKTFAHATYKTISINQLTWPICRNTWVFTLVTLTITYDTFFNISGLASLNDISIKTLVWFLILAHSFNCFFILLQIKNNIRVCTIVQLYFQYIKTHPKMLLVNKLVET